MPGWGTNKSRPDAGASRQFDGVVRLPGETEPLTVSITITDAAVAMRSDDLELGSWPPDEVTISRIDPWTFSFVAEGDRLVFVPDDARTFASNPLVRAPQTSNSPAKPKKLRFRRLRETPNRSSGVDAGEPQRRVPPVRTPKPVEATSAQRPARSESIASGDKEKRPGAWIRAVDAARENGLFGLDRVPVSMQLRDQDHQHTYDHGAASATGLGNRICTICGRVRLRG